MTFEEVVTVESVVRTQWEMLGRAEGRIFKYREAGRKHSVSGEGEIKDVRGG